MLKLRNQAGDTIVEVMISTAILGFVIGGAYALTTKSLQISRAAQERSEALKLAESQVEYLKYQARTDLNFDSNYRNGPVYCFNAANGTKTSGGACAQGDGGRYRMEITYTNDISSDPARRLGTFNVRASWERIGGGQDEMIINYQT